MNMNCYRRKIYFCKLWILLGLGLFVITTSIFAAYQQQYGYYDGLPRYPKQSPCPNCGNSGLGREPDIGFWDSTFYSCKCICKKCGYKWFGDGRILTQLREEREEQERERRQKEEERREQAAEREREKQRQIKISNQRKESYTEGVNFFNKKQYEKAVEKLQSAQSNSEELNNGYKKEITDEQIEKMLNQSRIKLRDVYSDEAIKMFNNGDDVEKIINKFQSILDLDKEIFKDNKLTVLKKAEVHKYLAKLYFKSKDYEKAKKSCEIVLAAKISDSEIDKIFKKSNKIIKKRQRTEERKRIFAEPKAGFSFGSTSLYPVGEMITLTAGSEKIKFSNVIGKMEGFFISYSAYGAFNKDLPKENDYMLIKFSYYPLKDVSYKYGSSGEYEITSIGACDLGLNWNMLLYSGIFNPYIGAGLDIGLISVDSTEPEKFSLSDDEETKGGYIIGLPVVSGGFLIRPTPYFSIDVSASSDLILVVPSTLRLNLSAVIWW